MGQTGRILFYYVIYVTTQCHLHLQSQRRCLLGYQMKTLGIEATPEELDLMVDEIDQDNNGEIDFKGIQLRLSAR